MYLWNVEDFIAVMVAVSFVATVCTDVSVGARVDDGTPASIVEGEAGICQR